jgi:hypothetical protein
MQNSQEIRIFVRFLCYYLGRFRKWIISNCRRWQILHGLTSIIWNLFQTLWLIFQTKVVVYRFWIEKWRSELSLMDFTQVLLGFLYPTCIFRGSFHHSDACPILLRFFQYNTEGENAKTSECVRRYFFRGEIETRSNNFWQHWLKKKNKTLNKKWKSSEI